ncbi:MAG: phosphoribosylformylglycinamidine synthase subunit PurQ [Ferrimicrobium sp.]
MSRVIGVLSFPGTNCEFDVAEVVSRIGANAKLLNHRSTDLKDVDGVILPGGFSYGDYLRPGAVARFSPVMRAVEDFGRRGGPILGICNGFQILTEAGLLPGALQKNRNLSFICEEVELVVATQQSSITRTLKVGTRLRLPINHFEGNYTCDTDTERLLVERDLVVLRYVSNPNGSMNDIAGITNEGRNIVGMMPHPEREGIHFAGENGSRYELLRSFISTW